MEPLGYQNWICLIHIRLVKGKLIFMKFAKIYYYPYLQFLAQAMQNYFITDQENKIRKGDLP